MESEPDKIARFEDAVCTIAERALDAAVQKMTYSHMRAQLTEPFGGPWVEANRDRIPALIESVVSARNLAHFRLCIEGMAQSSREKRENLTAAACRAQLVPGTFAAPLFERHRRKIPQIVREYARLVNDSGVRTARINTDKIYDLPLATPSCQGHHPICTMHAVAFSISSQLRRLYGQAYAVKRDQILYVMQAICNSWLPATASEVVQSMKDAVCDNEDVWFSNDWGDRRLRISVRADDTDHDGMLADLGRGISVPCIIVSNHVNHMVCAVQMMHNGGENTGKVMALNSWGNFEPVVVICKDQPQYSDEYTLIRACRITVRIVAVRSGNNRVLNTPVPRY